MRSIAKVFGRSPFVPLQMHMERVAECINLVQIIFEPYRQGDMDKVRSLAQELSKFEHEADHLKHDIRNNMPRGLFMPVDRSNLLRILSTQDSIANHAENIGVILTFKHARVFEGFNPAFDTFLNNGIETFALTRSIVDELDELLETGFGGVEANSVRELVDKVALKEHETDVCQHGLVRDLLAHEDVISYGDFFLWTRIIRQISTIADKSESLAVEVRTTLEAN
jgi:uncharacterized protein